MISLRITENGQLLSISESFIIFINFYFLTQYPIDEAKTN